MRAEEVGVLLRHRVGRRDDAEERLHLPGGREGDEDAPAPRADMRPDVRDAPWRQQRVAGTQPRTLIADLDHELAFECVEDLVLLVVQMAWRSALRGEDVLQDEEVATVILRRHLELDGADAEAAMLAEAVPASGNIQRRRSCGRG